MLMSVRRHVRETAQKKAARIKRVQPAQRRLGVAECLRRHALAPVLAGQALHRDLPHHLVGLHDRPVLPARLDGLREPELVAPVHVLRAQHRVGAIVGKPLLRAVFLQHVEAREQQIAKRLAADEFVDLVMDDARPRVVPQRGERAVDDGERLHEHDSSCVCIA